MEVGSGSGSHLSCSALLFRPLSSAPERRTAPTTALTITLQQQQQQRQIQLQGWPRQERGQDGGEGARELQQMTGARRKNRRDDEQL